MASTLIAISYLLIMAIIMETKNTRSLLIFKVLPAAIALWLAYDNFVIGIK